MKSYKVTDPKGITVNGKRYEKGETVRLGRSAATNAFLHFKQVKELVDKPPAAEPKTAEPKAGEAPEPKPAAK
ncbi:hypothetical protein [Luteolibacter marinus]|uniref:hypothetical protein n=1 Tax=Luteolibacter marinus TaxID=2776705 RepID=UPI0018660E99|nr:hypothetical protein [Luteolibacter marinus]